MRDKDTRFWCSAQRFCVSMFASTSSSSFDSACSSAASSLERSGCCSFKEAQVVRPVQGATCSSVAYSYSPRLDFRLVLLTVCGRNHARQMTSFTHYSRRTFHAQPRSKRIFKLDARRETQMLHEKSSWKIGTRRKGALLHNFNKQHAGCRCKINVTYPLVQRLGKTSVIFDLHWYFFAWAGSPESINYNAEVV